MLSQFARMNQSIEHLTPTAKNAQMRKWWESFDDKKLLVQIMSMEYPRNNIGGKKAMRWVVSALRVFKEEVEIEVDVHGDLGEGIYYFGGDNEDSQLTLKQFYQLLTLDGNKSENYTLFAEAFNQMSPLERKWFLRYWVRKPRNGVQNANILKLLSGVYGHALCHVKRDAALHSPASLVEYYEAGERPAPELTHGVFIAPMLAKAIETHKWPKRRIYEYKYDGARYQIHRKDDSVIVFNRRGKVVNDQYQDIIELVKEIPHRNFIIDTEIYPVEGGKPASFQKLGTRIHSKDHERAVLECPVQLAIFDVLSFEDTPLIDRALNTRLEYLERFPHRAKFEMECDFKAFYSQAIADGFEGIMVKNLMSLYAPGKRSPDWAKYKPPRIELDVVITGARYGEGKRSHVFASFDIAVVDDDGAWCNIGAIGSGFSDGDFRSLTSQLRPIVTEYENGTYEVLPRIVLEVTSDLVTRNADGTYALRFPRLVAIRDDKPVSDINTLTDVMGMI